MATILGSGYVLMTVHTLYDLAVYITTEEYEAKIGKKVTEGYGRATGALYFVHVKLRISRPACYNR